MTLSALKPSHKAILAYHAKIREFDAGSVGHESGRSPAFHNLLDETARSRGWLLVDQLSHKVRGKTIRPDGTLRDAEWLFPRGYWEAKDTDDDLDAEIRKKVARGYPLVNTIFEDTRTGVLFQNGAEVARARLDDPVALAGFLNAFYDHTERDIEGFEQAVSEFRDRIPHHAEALAKKIEAAHEAVPRFQSAFEGLMELCRSALNPNIRVAAVDEMLVQHLLTERLFRTVFDNADFVKRNVIAAEIETVIEALVSKSFNRAEFFKSLDPFYKAIEDKARTIDDFAQKQHFLNTVYERFFQGYSVKTADTHGIVYTPQPIVDFMCASVQEVLKSEFGRDLGSEGVHILDPCTGTGNFIVNLLRRIGPRDLKRAYREGLFANEVMLLPYYIAAQNIEHEYYDLTGQYEPFEGLCFVDTLELAEAEQATLSFMTEENTARVAREKKAPINVIIGNPPYNAWQLNENDNNKNRKYPVIGKRVSGTFTKDSKATNKSALSDPYVKFFRWAIDRLSGNDGIVCFVSNNSFLDQIAFDGMRKHLFKDFTRIFHLDLRGNVRHNPKLSGMAYNVFGIQVGVGITIAVRRGTRRDGRIHFFRITEDWKKERKLEWLEERGNVNHVEWTSLVPDDRSTWLVAEHGDEFTGMIPMGGRRDGGADGELPLFGAYSPGVKTNRDDEVYNFSQSNLRSSIVRFVEAYNGEVDRYRRSKTKGDIDEFVDYKLIKWSRDLKADLKRERYAEVDDSKFRHSLYRPFCKQFLFFDRILNEEVYSLPAFYPQAAATECNVAISLTGIGSEKPFMCIVSNWTVTV